MGAFRCPECDHVGGNAADEALEAIGAIICQECGHTGMDDDFEYVEDDDADGM